MLPELGPQLQIEQIKGYLWIRPRGELDITAANLLSKNIIDSIGENARLPVIFDLSLTDYINSTVLGLLAHLVNLYREKKLDFIFFQPSNLALRLFEETCLLKVIQVCRSKAELPAAAQ